MLKKLTTQQKDILKIAVAAVIFVIAMVIHHVDHHAEGASGTAQIISIVLFLAAYVIVGYGPVSKAVRNISHGEVFDENFLMTVATIGALLLRQWDEAVAVMLFYAIGEAFEHYAVNKSRGSISDLMDICPDYANRLTEDGEETVDPYDVMPGDIIIVRPGERIPLDGIIVDGASSLDSSALTGESIPIDVEKGMAVSSGCIDLTGVLKIEVTSEFDDSTVARILDLVENSGSKKARVEKFITKFARYYTPAVVFSALALAIIPPLILHGGWSVWVYRALLFLIISCPCALVISVPLAFFGGVGAASRIGVLVKGSDYLEAMADVDTIVFDKTGTLTTGIFKVSNVRPACDANGEDVIGSEQLLGIAAHIEMFSNHPIARSIKEAYGKELTESGVTDVTEISGKGMRAVIEGSAYYAGNAGLMHDLGIDDYPQQEAATLVHIAYAGDGAAPEAGGAVYLGYIAIADTVKPGVEKAISKMKESGITKTVMLTGDREVIADRVAQELGIDEHVAGLLPEGKVEAFESLITGSSGKVAFVGDGINDAPTLARADVGLAMGGMGQQAAIEAADIVIMDDDPAKIPLIKRIAKRTLSIAKQNVVFALVIKFAVLILGAVGLANMWLAVFADVGVSVICILNSMRMIVSSRKEAENI